MRNQLQTQEQIIMDQFELGEPGSPLQAPRPPQLHSHRYHINKLFRICRKHHARIFLNNLKSCVLRVLITYAERSTPPLSRFPLPQTTIEFEFVSMCASKIQAMFKGYITRKYYLKASKRLKAFQLKLSSVVAGWKTRQILRCTKMQEAIGVIHSKRKEALKQQESYQQSFNAYSRKKLQYLMRSLREQVAQFVARFDTFYQGHGWVFEPKSKPSLSFVHSPLYRAHSEAVPPPYQEPKQRQRVREMRDRNRKPLPAKEQKADAEPKVQLQATNQEQVRISSERFIERKVQEGQTEERPIRAKGTYSIDDADDATQGLPQMSSKGQGNSKNSPTTEASNSQGDQNDNEAQLSKMAKKIEKAKLEKRQKYDPRKAIMEEKKKKEMLKKAELAENSSQPASVDAIKAPTEPRKEERGPQSLKIEDNKGEDKREKTRIENTVKGDLQAMGKEIRMEGNRGTVAMPRTNKAKAEPKIDCWANRKTNKFKAVEENRITSRGVHEKDEKLVSLEQIKRQFMAEKDPDRHRHKVSQLETLQTKQQFREQQGIRGNYACEMVVVRKKETQEARRAYHPEAENIKQKRAGGNREESREREGHKFIQEIEAVYSNQYQSRMQKLLPKLTLLSAAREQECRGLIPVLAESSSFVKQKISENSSNHRFWLTASRIEKTFKDFDKP